MKKGQFVLVGVLLAQPRQAALLRDVQTNKTETVVVGASVRGLVLEKVAPDRVHIAPGRGNGGVDPGCAAGQQTCSCSSRYGAFCEPGNHITITGFQTDTHADGATATDPKRLP